MIDKELKNCIAILNDNGIKTLACCSGHGVYPPTIIIRYWKDNVELLSGKVIRRKKRFYRKDGRGRYYIPEISKPKRTRRSPSKHWRW